jgi:hypothetical protein
LALDESTDDSDTAQLALFVRGVYKYSNITEKVAVLVLLKGTTVHSYLLECLIADSIRLSLNLTNLLGVKTDGAPAMGGRREGLVVLRQEEVN